ncbi:XRRA1 protein, partial [Amia calva]|nr:XRRA1 protein [Amia calva]
MIACVLQVLDLSYNSLSSQEVLSLGLLPCLRVLHLTGNGLQALPLNMAQPYQAPTQLASNHGLRFYSLEILILDDNKLSSPGIFTSLANLKRLKHLNLDRNGITQVPYLHQIGDSAQDAQLPDLNMQFGVKGHDEAVGGGTSPSMGPTTASTVSFQEEPWLTAGVPRTETQREDPAEFQLPLPELQFLSLADNKISEEEALLAVALFPSLSELVIHSNPLTTQKSGDPPLLTGFLQNRLGIKIQRKKTVGPAKPPLVLPVNPKRKVKTRIPKIPKKSLCLEDSLGSLPLSERPADTWKSHIQYKPLPPIQSLSQVNSEESQQAEAVAWVQGEAVHEEATRHEPEEHEKEDNGAAFFMTQVNEPESDAGWHTSLQESEETHRKTQRPKEDSVPDKFRGYEILLDAKPDPDMIEPTGIQQNVRALEYTLQNLLVFRDSRARLDCPQKPYVQKEKKLGKLPPPKPRKSKGDKVEEFLVKIKDTKPISEAPLGNVLQNKEVSRTEYEEARALLREMKRQYRVAQSKVMDQAAQIERDTLGDLEEKRGGK